MPRYFKSFKHKCLKELYISGSKKCINPEHAKKLMRILDRLDASKVPQDMNLPGYKLHILSGKSTDIWSIFISENWIVTFYFKDGNAYIVDYLDYH